MEKTKEPAIGMLICEIGQVAGVKWNGISRVTEPQNIN